MAAWTARRPQQRGAAGFAAAAAAAAVLFVLPLAAAQMVSPLQGQGKPLLETQDIWFNAYLDRLIDAAWRNGTRQCSLQCTDWGRNVACCDEIFMLSIVFRNAYSFPEDRPSLNKVYLTPPPSTTVVWVSTVLGEFYQQMSLKHFPFDSYGAGDDVSDWRVTGVRLTHKLASNESFIFQLASPDPSHPTDPLPLSDPTASRTLTALLPGGFCTILPVALLGWLSFVILVLDRRDLSARLGVTVTLFLALAAFVVTADQPASSYILPTQQQIVTTYCLLLCMAVEATAVHSIETYKERQKTGKRQREARQRYLARMAAIKRLEQEEADAAARHAATGLPSHQPPELARASAGVAGSAGSTTAAAARRADSLPAAASGSLDALLAPGELIFLRHGTFTRSATLGRLRAMRGHPMSARVVCGVEGTEGGVPRTNLRATLNVRVWRREAMEDDELMCQWVAQQVDHASAAILFIGYNLAVVPIYGLQSGYLDLLVWEGPAPPWGE
ncbi:ligand-gated ion channel isoform A [Micractinium conductrix]|uniref:Ligand-gated ion channel isoform A n=1 Tax=Micractinium conductrix TaxID=554055 RepID=A0A2P6V027_9CHLO|nr:ligand-gated ion channel isoform A [Micractinium conductrix]|eukprot:PSC67447.1 ligand-gated ion channel isoform A [Micractinium conductrix]